VIRPNQATLRKAIAEQEQQGTHAIGLVRLHPPSALRRERTEEGREQQQREGDGDPRDGEQQPAREPEREHERGRRDRPEGEAEVAADREERHRARPPAATGEGGELRAFGVKGRHAEAGDDDEEKHERIARRRRGERDPDSRERNAARQQPDRSTPVRPQPEQRLHDRRRDRGGEHRGRRQRVREVELLDKEGKQRRQSAVREVGRAVAARERRHRTLVELRPHGRRLASGENQATPGAATGAW